MKQFCKRHDIGTADKVMIAVIGILFIAVVIGQVLIKTGHIVP